MLPTIKRGLYSWLSRAAKSSSQQVVDVNPLCSSLGTRVLSSVTTSTFLKRRAGNVGARHHELATSLSPAPLRHPAAGACQLSALEVPEEVEGEYEPDWEKKTAFFLSIGLSKDQALHLLTVCPLLLNLSLEDELEPKVSFLRALGVNDLAKVIMAHPNLLVCKTEASLTPKVAFFESLGIQRQSIGKIIERYPTVLTYTVEGNMMSKTRFLESIGLERESIARVIMRSPYIFALSIEENMRPKVELLESIGVDKKFIGKLITRCPKIFCLSNEDNVLPKIKYLESVGVEKGSMGKIVATCPSILNLSTSHIQQKLDFLQNNEYSVKKIVNQFPQYLTYSLEQRIKPRHKFIADLKDLGVLKKDYSLSYILHMSHEKFQKHFGHSHPHSVSFYTGS